MDFLVDRLRFLGLNEREVRVFTALATFGRMNMTKIASRAGVPRTTVDAITKRLIEQGLVTRERVRSHFEYSVDLDNVADTLDWLEKRLRTNGGKQADETEAKILNDENIVKSESDVNFSVESAFTQRSGDRSRILLARSPDDLLGALRRLTMYVSNAVQTSTKLEILTCAQVADSIHRNGIGSVTWSDADLIRINVVPSTYCRTETDIIIFPDRVLLRDIRGSYLQCERDTRTVEAMKHLLDIACETGWSINLRAWISEV